MGGLLARIDMWQRNHRWMAFPFSVLKKFSEDQSGNLAALIAYYAFFSIFPLLLALSSVLGFILAGHPDLQRQVTQSAVKQIPLIGNNQPPPMKGSFAAVIVGGALALYSGLAVAKQAQTAWDTVYLVSRTDQPGFLPKTVRALRLIVVGGLGLIVTTIISGAAASGKSLGINIGPGFTILGIAISVVLNTGLFVLLFRWLTVRPVSYRDAFPGALMAAIAFQILQTAATAFISHKLKSANSTYGSFATVIVLLSWFYLQAQVVLLAAQVNVVKQYRLWPRALKDAPATDADFRAYEAYAERERFQPHQDVDTDFDAADIEHDPTADEEEKEKARERARKSREASRKRNPSKASEGAGQRRSKRTSAKRTTT